MNYSAEGLAFDLFGVVEESLQTNVGERMFEKLHEHAEWGGNDIGADFCGLHKVHRGAGTGCEDLCFDAVVVVNAADVFDEGHTLGRDVVEATDKWGDVSGAGLGCQQGL